jgi:hypothetical protein
VDFSEVKMKLRSGGPSSPALSSPDVPKAKVEQKIEAPKAGAPNAVELEQSNAERKVQQDQKLRRQPPPEVTTANRRIADRLKDFGQKIRVGIVDFRRSLAPTVTELERARGHHLQRSPAYRAMDDFSRIYAQVGDEQSAQKLRDLMRQVERLSIQKKIKDESSRVLNDFLQITKAASVSRPSARQYISQQLSGFQKGQRLDFNKLKQAAWLTAADGIHDRMLSSGVDKPGPSHQLISRFEASLKKQAEISGDSAFQRSAQQALDRLRTSRIDIQTLQMSGTIPDLIAERNRLRDLQAKAPDFIPPRSYEARSSDLKRLDPVVIEQLSKPVGERLIFSQVQFDAMRRNGTADHLEQSILDSRAADRTKQMLAERFRNIGISLPDLDRSAILADYQRVESQRMNARHLVLNLRGNPMSISGVTQDSLAYNYSQNAGRLVAARSNDPLAFPAGLRARDSSLPWDEQVKLTGANEKDRLAIRAKLDRMNASYVESHHNEIVAKYGDIARINAFQQRDSKGFAQAVKQLEEKERKLAPKTKSELDAYILAANQRIQDRRRVEQEARERLAEMSRRYQPANEQPKRLHPAAIWRALTA